MRLIAIISSILLCFSVSQAQDWASNATYKRDAIWSFDEDPNEGKIPIGQQEIPDAVMKAFQSSLFQHMEIDQVFRLQDQALNEIIISDEKGLLFYLYEFRLNYEGRSFCQYFTPEGDLYEHHRSV